jgi:hypothetical protein
MILKGMATPNGDDATISLQRVKQLVQGFPITRMKRIIGMRSKTLGRERPEAAVETKFS